MNTRTFWPCTESDILWVVYLFELEAIIMQALGKSITSVSLYFEINFIPL